MKTPTNDAPNFSYLRNRPFLLIQFSKVPAQQKGTSHTRTERKGWMEEQGNITIHEQPLMVDRVSDKHLANSNIIIDILADKLIKNSLSDNANDVLIHFKSKYADLIAQGQQAWLRSQT